MSYPFLFYPEVIVKYITSPDNTCEGGLQVCMQGPVLTKNLLGQAKISMKIFQF